MGVGRVQRHPLGPSTAQKIKVARCMHFGQQRVVHGHRALHRAQLTLLELGQHIVGPRRDFKTGDEFAPKHL